MLKHCESSERDFNASLTILRDIRNVSLDPFHCVRCHQVLRPSARDEYNYVLLCVGNLTMVIKAQSPAGFKVNKRY